MIIVCFVSCKIFGRWFGGNINVNKSRRDMPADAYLFDGLGNKPLLALTHHSLSQREPLVWSIPYVSNHEVSCALVTGGVSDTGGGTSVPSVSCMQSNLLCKARRRSISEAGGEVG